MAATIITCENHYFPGFINPDNKYKTARLDDHDGCHPNGFVTIQWVGYPDYCPNTIVTESTEDYSSIYPIGYSGLNFYDLDLFNIVDSDTYAYFWSTCQEDPPNTIKISITLSDLITTTGCF